MTKLTDLTELTDIAPGDLLHVVDISDNAQNAAGSSKKVKVSSLLTTSHSKMQIVATRGCISNNRISDATYTRMESRKKYYFGSQPVTQLRVAHSGIYLLSGGSGEVSLGNDCNFEAGIEVDSRWQAVFRYGRGARVFCPSSMAAPRR